MIIVAQTLVLNENEYVVSAEMACGRDYAVFHKGERLHDVTGIVRLVR